MKILSCNVRTAYSNDGENNWVNRKDLCINVILSKSPDIICFQEMSIMQFNDISSKLLEYSSYSMVDEPVGNNPQNAIFYKNNKYTLVSSGGYWLSESPHIAGTKSWNSACIRLANWVRLKDNATNAEFRVINTHLDHISQLARENQARLIVEDSIAYPENYPQILTGDMNCDSSNTAVDIFKHGGWCDTYNYVHGTENPGRTFHEFVGSKCKDEVGKMDWIFIKGKLKTTSATIIKDAIGDKFPSDHYFISASVKIIV
ncbi:MAG: endonuclease/exonuclease/phosphatase family protein [Kiritimatiellae bacterium]|jgi:endonuclease/exonuclease/phosphatase family metal-dependent hydrolase|nr:endonuclease/exonuclease/phosphatase family protein [Kiritimatiellia bacterium]